MHNKNKFITDHGVSKQKMLKEMEQLNHELRTSDQKLSVHIEYAILRHYQQLENKVASTYYLTKRINQHVIELSMSFKNVHESSKLNNNKSAI